LALIRVLDKYSSEVLLISDRENGPQDDYENRKRQPGRGHERVKEENIHDHRPKYNERQRNKSVYQQQQPTDDLNAKNNYPIVRRKDRAEVLACHTGGRGHRNEVKKSVRPENKEDQT
jgi:hypothetical protein